MKHTDVRLSESSRTLNDQVSDVIAHSRCGHPHFSLTLLIL
jgi:hypothetical protein